MPPPVRTPSPKSPQWTLEQLCSMAERVLEMAGVTSESGRIRSTPDERTLRYYTTLGLLSRPAAFRGRTALYQRHHLAQIVALKRLQAGGLPLSEVQVQLTGLTPAELERLAQLPVELPELSVLARTVETLHQERPTRLEARSLPRTPARREGSASTGSWINLGSGVVLMLPVPLGGSAEGLLDVLQASSPLLAELRRQGLIDPKE